MSEKDKKKLLEEGTLRRWMQMAGNDHLTDSFLTRLQENVLGEQEEEVPPMDGVPPVGGDMGGLDLDPAAVEQLVKVIADAISSATGTPVDVAGGAEAPDDMPPAEIPPELPPEEEAPLQEKVDAKAYKGDMKDQEYKGAKDSKKNAGPLEEEVIEEEGEPLEEEVVEEEVEESVEDLMENVVSKVMSRVLEELKKRK